MATATGKASGAFATAQSRALNFQPMMYMQEYLDELAGEGRNHDYLRTVRVGLCRFADFLRENEGITHPEEISRINILHFQAWLNDPVQGFKKSSAIQILKKVRAWLNWASNPELGYLEVNPWNAIRVGAVAKKPKPIEEEDIEILFATHYRDANAMDSFTFHRREIILMMLYAWGLRRHELQGLDIHDVDLRKSFVITRNKGGDTKELPYLDELKSVVARWLSQRGRYAKREEDALLITSNGNRLSVSQIYDIITDLGRRAGVTINPHRLRDTCATTLVDDDVPLDRIMKIMGHKQLSQTMAYAEVRNKKVAESLEGSMGPRLNRLTFLRTRDLAQ